jgi:hypothetical protein
MPIDGGDAHRRGDQAGIERPAPRQRAGDVGQRPVDRPGQLQGARRRAAAMLITSVEGSELHLPDLMARGEQFDPMTRYRFLAGTLVPAGWYAHVQRFRRWY